MIKLIVWQFDEYTYIGYGETLLECIYDLSNEKMKEGILLELSESYAGGERFYNDGEFLEDKYNDYISNLSNSCINDRIYRWCNRNNYKYHIEDN